MNKRIYATPNLSGTAGAAIKHAGIGVAAPDTAGKRQVDVQAHTTMQESLSRKGSGRPTCRDGTARSGRPAASAGPALVASNETVPEGANHATPFGTAMDAHGNVASDVTTAPSSSGKASVSAGAGFNRWSRGLPIPFQASADYLRGGRCHDLQSKTGRMRKRLLRFQQLNVLRPAATQRTGN